MTYNTSNLRVQSSAKHLRQKLGAALGTRLERGSKIIVLSKLYKKNQIINIKYILNYAFVCIYYNNHWYILCIYIFFFL